MAISAQAQYTRVLIPVVASNVDGLFGSLWKTELIAFNNSEQPVSIGYDYRCIALCGGVGADPGRALDMSNILTPPGFPTALVLIPKEARDVMEFALRVRDVSRQADSWGTAIPVVWEDRTFSRPFDLLNIPLASRFRQSLRVYDLSATSATNVLVQYYSMTSGALLKEYTLQLALRFPGDPYDPAYAELNLFGEAPELAGVDRIRVRISPTSATQRVWAMVSVTNNVTQELTIISP